jgi:hypothetical protein
MPVDNGFFYVSLGFTVLGVSGLIAFALLSMGSTSKYWLSLVVDRLTLTVNLTPSQVQRRLAATINPFTPEISGPYIEQWITSDAFQIDRFAKSWLVSAHGEIWPHPEGALVSVTLRAYGLWLLLLPFFLMIIPFAFSSLTTLVLSLGVILLVGIGYYYHCLTEIRRTRTFLTNLLNAAEQAELPATRPGVGYQEPLVFDDHAELEKSKDRLILTSSEISSGCFVISILAIGWTVIMGLLSLSLVREVRTPMLTPGSGLWVLFIIFFMAMLSAGPVLLYYALAIWLNRTVVTLTRQTLSIRYQPLPVSRDITIPPAELKQLYPKRVVVLASKGGAEMAVRYELRALLKSYKHITLFEFKSPQEVLYTKQQIEAWLRLNGYVVEA